MRRRKPLDQSCRRRAAGAGIPGLASIGAALLLFARTPVDASYAVDVLPAMTLLGLGAGLAFPALTTVAMSGATATDSGLASGLVNTSINVGGAIGLAVLATLATDHTNGLIARGEAHAAALNAGYHLAYLLSAVAVAAAIGLASMVLRSTCSGAERREPTVEVGAATPCPEAA